MEVYILQSATHNVDIAKIAVPVLVNGVRCLEEIPRLQSLVDNLSGMVKLVQDPFLSQGLFARKHGSLGSEVLVKVSKNELGGLEDLVAELAVTVEDVNFSVDIQA